LTYHPIIATAKAVKANAIYRDSPKTEYPYTRLIK